MSIFQGAHFGQNETVHDIKVPAGHMIAELSLPMAVSPLPTHDTKASSNEQSHPEPASIACTSMHVSDSGKLTFDFADLALPEWKERITKKFNSMSDIFALSDLDYGHTTEVKHQIHLLDPSPFKQTNPPF